MCQPRFFSPFLLCALRLAARDETTALKDWLDTFRLPELQDPVRELVDAIRARHPSALSEDPTAAPSALERSIACSLCSCVVDPEPALEDFGEDLDLGTRTRISLCLQAIGLTLNSRAGHLQRRWAQVVSRPGSVSASIPSCSSRAGTPTPPPVGGRRR
jgi:hypothetical protein